MANGLRLLAQYVPGWNLIDAISASSSQKRFIGKSAVAISLKSPISFLVRCDRCLTKIYCSKECLKEDLRTKHEDACKRESDPRKVKVKEKRKLRKEAEKARVEEGTADLMNKLDLDGNEDLKKNALEALEQFTNAKM